MGGSLFDMQNLMWLEANLKVSFYQPEKLEQGMIFMNSLYPGTDKEFVELWLLEEDIIEEEYDKFINKNGFPVEIMVTMEMSNPDEPDYIVAYFPEIGWIHQDDDSIREFDIDDANWIIQNNNGSVCVLIDEEAYDQDGTIYTITEEQLVIMKYQFADDIYDEDHDWDEYLEE
jgi:hypothetical protein